MNAPESVTVSETAFSPVAPNPWHAVGGVWRLTVRRWLSRGHLLACAGLIVLLAGIALATNPRGDAAAYFEWWAGFFLGVVVPVLAFLSGAGAIRDDLRPGAVDYLFTRPVRRPIYLVARYLSQLACVQLAYLAAFSGLVAVGLYREIPGLAAGLPLLLLAQMLTVSGFLALGFLCALLVSRYLILGLFYAGLVEAGAGLIPTQLSRLSMTRQIRDLLAPLAAPVSDAANASAPAAHAAGAGAFGTTLLLLLFTSVFVAAASAVFSIKELSGAPGRE